MAARGGRDAGPDVLGRSEVERRVSLIAGRRAWSPVAVSRIALFHCMLRSALAAPAPADAADRQARISSVARLLQHAPTAGYGLASLAAAVMVAPRGSDSDAAVAVASAIVCGAALVDRVAQRMPQALAVLSAGAVGHLAVLEAAQASAADAPCGIDSSALLPALEMFARLEVACAELEIQAAATALQASSAAKLQASFDTPERKGRLSALRKLGQGFRGLVRSHNEAQLADAAVLRAHELAGLQSE